MSHSFGLVMLSGLVLECPLKIKTIVRISRRGHGIGVMRPGDPPSPRPMAQQIASAYCALCGLPLGGERTGDAGDIDRPFNRIAAFGCSFVDDEADVAGEGELERLPLQRPREVAFETRGDMAGDFLAFDLERNRPRPA